MSADDWQECPKCDYESRKYLDDNYGDMAKEDYDRHVKELETQEPTVRIDYSYSLDCTGTYSFDFCATCQTCGHEFTEDLQK